jgi:transposase-like protein
MAKAKSKRRKRYTPEQRSQILAAAQREGLTAAAVQKRFGVSAVTYYSWRKKSGAPKRRGKRATARSSQNGGLKSRVRGAVDTRMRDLLPQLVEAEISRYLDEALGTSARKRG